MTRGFLIALWLLGCTGDREPQRVTPNSPDVRDAGVGPRDAAPSKLIGVLTASESADIAPRVAGVIKIVRVGVGDKVSAGQVVAEMDPAQLRDELRGAEAALAAASAALSAASVDVEDARRKVGLETKAVASGVSPTANLDQAKFDLRRAEAVLQRARSTAAAEAARAQTARDHLSDAGLRAPFAGVVAHRYRDAGNRVEAGGPIISIVGDGSMRLRFAVPPQMSGAIKLGANVTAKLETISTPVSATIKQVHPTIDASSGMIFVDAELSSENPIAGLRHGLAAWVDPL